MINANELRIGNKVQTGIKEIAFITIKTIGLAGVNGEWHDDEDMTAEGVEHEMYFEEIKFEDCYPIPLTPEILEKCGFNKSHHGYVELDKEEFNLAFDETGLDIAFHGNDVANSLPHIKNLHQVQNLFFALTGEELTINLHVAV